MNHDKLPSYHQGNYVGPAIYRKGTVAVHRTSAHDAQTPATEFTVIDYGETPARWLRTFSGSEFLRPHDEAIAFADATILQ